MTSIVAIFCQSARAGNAMVEIRAARTAVVVRIMASPRQVIGAGLRIAVEIIGRRLRGSIGFRGVHGTLKDKSGHVDAIIATSKNPSMRRFRQPEMHLPLPSNSMVHPVIAR